MFVAVILCHISGIVQLFWSKVYLYFVHIVRKALIKKSKSLEQHLLGFCCYNQICNYVNN